MVKKEENWYLVVVFIDSPEAYVPLDPYDQKREFRLVNLGTTDWGKAKDGAHLILNRLRISGNSIIEHEVLKESELWDAPLVEAIGVKAKEDLIALQEENPEFLKPSSGAIKWMKR